MKRTHRALFHAFLATLAIGIVLTVSNASAQERQPKLDPEGELERLERVHREGMNDPNTRATGEDIRGREEWFAFQRRFPYDMIPANLRTDALREQRRQTELLERALGAKRWNAGVLAANRWEEIGPYNFSGRIRGIAIRPGDGQTIYLGSAAGGLWKTTDAGSSWRTNTDTLTSLAVCAVAVDPANPNVIYIGTGENSVNVDRYDGDGVFKSTDGGVTWKNIGLQNVAAFSKLAVHPQNSRILYAAGARGNAGFYRSEDGGATWKVIVNGDIWDLAVNPLNGDEVYIALTTSIRRSTDAGKTFTSVNNGLTLTRGIRISLALSPAQTNRVYALVARDPGNGTNHIGEAYVTTNSGESWTLKKTFDQFFFNKQAWYDHCAAADPFDPNVVLMGGVDVYRSSDGGTSWTNTTRSYTGGNVHPDQHVLQFEASNPGEVVLGNDGGAYLSVDGGATWERISTELPNGQYYQLELDQSKPYRVYGGTQDNGTHGHYGTSGFVKDWQRVLAGDGFFVAVDYSDPNTIYAEQFNGTPLYRIDANNLNSRTRIDASISTDSETGDPGSWVTPIAVSPADKKSIYTGRSQLYKSTTRGSNWRPVYATTGRSVKITCIGLSPADTSHMLISRTNGEVLYTTDAGVTWTRSTGAPSRQCTDLVFDPRLPARVYATFSGSGGTHVYRSDDFGATFQSISSGLPDIPTNAIAVDPANTDHLFVGTDIGVYMSFNGGGSWVPFNNGLALSPVIDLKVHTTGRYLYAATHGRSMFRVNIDGLTAPPILISPTTGQTYATPAQIPVRYSGLVGPTHIQISYDGGANWRSVADDVVGDSTSISVPLARSSMTRVRVTEKSGERRAVESGNFSLTAAGNCQDLGKKGFIAEAIEYRQGLIWATTRGSDSIYRLRMPLLGGRTGLLRTNIPGRVRDLAYDPTADRFYALVTDNDYANPKLYRMDTNGVGQGQVTIPGDLTHISGVAYDQANGIALVTPGSTGEVVYINDSGMVIRRGEHISGTGDNDRRSLVWDKLGLVQGTVNPDPAAIFPSQLQFMTADLRVREFSTLVPPSAQRFDFYGLAIDASDPIIDNRVYVATDTAGNFCKCVREKFFTSSVEGGAATTGYAARNLALGAITPNPMRSDAEIRFTVRKRDVYTIELFDAAGILAGSAFDGTLDAGEHTVRFKDNGLASGVYYVALSSASGERDVRPLVVVR